MKRLIAVVLFIVACVIAWACSDQQATVQCYDIPQGGCPLQGGVACQDPTCAAAYTCNADGGWTLAYSCGAHDGSVQDTSIDSPPPNDAGHDIDAPPGAFGGPGCLGLEPPDCPLGTVLNCTSGCCGCTDLFVCDDGGWDPWGSCSDDGGVTQL